MPTIYVRVDDALHAAAKQRYGARGVAPRVRDLLAADLAGEDVAPARLDAPRPVLTAAGPRPRADRPGTLGPTCPRCGALATMQAGKPVCRLQCHR